MYASVKFILVIILLKVGRKKSLVYLRITESSRYS